MDAKTFRKNKQPHILHMLMLRSEKPREAYAQSFALWQQATIEFTCHDHSIIASSRHINILLFFAHIPFVVNHTINATPTERLQHLQWLQFRGGRLIWVGGHFEKAMFSRGQNLLMQWFSTYFGPWTTLQKKLCDGPLCCADTL